MVKRISIVGRPAERIEDTGRPLPRIEPAEFAAALGAESCGEHPAEDLDPVALAELGTQLLRRLRSRGGRPALDDATGTCKVPLSADDIAALEKVSSAVARETGARPSLGQVASVLLRMHLGTLGQPPRPSSGETGSAAQSGREEALSVAAARELIEDHLKPIREELKRLRKELNSRPKA